MSNEKVTMFFSMPTDIHAKLSKDRKPDVVQAEEKMKVLLKSTNDPMNETNLIWTRFELEERSLNDD